MWDGTSQVWWNHTTTLCWHHYWSDKANCDVLLFGVVLEDFQPPTSHLQRSFVKKLFKLNHVNPQKPIKECLHSGTSCSPEGEKGLLCRYCYDFTSKPHQNENPSIQRKPLNPTKGTQKPRIWCFCGEPLVCIYIYTSIASKRHPFIGRVHETWLWDLFFHHFSRPLWLARRMASSKLCRLAKVTSALLLWAHSGTCLSPGRLEYHVGKTPGHRHLLRIPYFGQLWWRYLTFSCV